MLKVKNIVIVTVVLLTTACNAHADLPKVADRALLDSVQQKTDELLSVATHYKKTLIEEEDEKNLVRFKKTARERKLLMRELAKKDPRAFLRNAIPKLKRDQLPKSIQGDIEQDAVLDASLNVLHIDDFKNYKNSYYEYFLYKDKKNLEFYPTRDIARRSGTKVRVKGYTLENIVVADIDSTATFKVLADAPPLDSVGEQNTLILYLRFSDTTQPDLSVEEIRNIVFNGKIQDFFREVSYGKVSFSGDVFEYTLSRKCAEGPITSVFDKDVSELVAELVAKNKILLQNYTRVVTVPDGSCSGYGGFSTVGKSDFTINGESYRFSVATVSGEALSINRSKYPYIWPSFAFVFAHEMGHSLGVLHANSIICDPPGILNGQNCRHQEYGNLFDTMGSGAYGLHFNALYKEILGWVYEAPVTQSETITLAPLESSSGRRYAKIQSRDASTPYYLEYRKPIGYDVWLAHPDLASNQNGIFVNIVQEDGLQQSSWLLDMRSTNDDNNGMEVTLNKGDPAYKDVGRGITIGPVTNVTANGVTFNVDITDPVCERRYSLRIQPDFYDSNAYKPGEKIYASVLIGNRDSIACGPSEFSYRIAGPAGWTLMPQNHLNPIVIQPSSSIVVWVNVNVPNVPNGNYTLEFSAKNINSGFESIAHRMYANIVTPPSDTIPPVINIVLPTGNNTTITTQKNSIPLISVSITDNSGSGIIGIDPSTAMWTNITNGKTGILTQTPYGWIGGPVALTSGSNTINISAKDISGNEGTESFKVTYSTGLPSSPTNLTRSCNTAGNRITLSWTAVKGATGYGLRLDDTTNNTATAKDGWYIKGTTDVINNNVTGTSITYPVVAGRSYRWWMYSKKGIVHNYADTAWYLGGLITCPASGTLPPPLATSTPPVVSVQKIAKSATPKPLKDKTPPVITIISPVGNGGATTTQKSAIDILANFTDKNGSGIASSTLMWSGIGVGIKGQFTQSQDGFIGGPVQLRSGLNRIIIRARDLANNQALAYIFVTYKPVVSTSTVSFDESDHDITSGLASIIDGLIALIDDLVMALSY